MHPLALPTGLDHKRAFGPSFVLGLVVVLAGGATATGNWWLYWSAASLLLLELYRVKPGVIRAGLCAAVLGYGV